MAIKSVPHSDPGLDKQSLPVKQTPLESHGDQETRSHQTHPPDRSNNGTWTAGLEPSFSLPQLSRLTRSEQYHSRRCRQVGHHLYHANITAARTARLALIARSVQRTLAECIRSEDKHSFANLFNVFHHALSECSSQPGEVENEDWAGKGTRGCYPPSFLDSLPMASRDLLLDFLMKVRQDSSFIANRLAALSHRELIGLLPEKGLTRSDDSVLGSSQRSSLRPSRNLGYVVDGQTELLSSYDLASPLEALIHSVRGWSAPNLQDDGYAVEVWATACARLVAEQKPGSEKLVPAVIDSWAASSPWPGKDRLEHWLLDTLQRGAFLLEHSQKETFRIRMQGLATVSNEEASRREQFYAEAVDSLLSLLSDSKGASIIPPGALKFCQAVIAKLGGSPGHQRAFPHFVITRWLFPGFLNDAVALPETHGLLADYFVSDFARQRILREVASRCSKVAFDVAYSWKIGNSPSERAQDFMRALERRFQCTDSPSPRASLKPCGTPEDFAFVAISASDIQMMVNGLYPAQSPPSLVDRDSSYPGLRSSASSISGLSLFPPSNGHNDRLLGELAGIVRDGEAASDSWHPEPGESPPGTSLGRNNANLLADMDGEQLREICVGIEDFLSRKRPNTPDHWCVLVDSGTEGHVCTIHHRMSGFSSPSVWNPSGDPNPSLHRSCRNTIEGLLDRGDLLDTDAPSVPKETEYALESTLVEVLKRRVANFEDSMDLVQAQSYSSKLRQFRSLCAGPTGLRSLVSILDGIGVDKQQSLEAALSGLDFCDALFRSTSPWSEHTSADLHRRMDTMKRLRNKMWYTADVRTSATYDEVRSVTSALKAMGKPQAPARTRLVPPSRTLNGSRGSFTNFHLKTETQILDLLTAPPGHGGRNKFGDDQSKALAAWMERNTIENLCRGEERVHKLCMEIQRVTDQVTSENSALIASELFARDRPSPQKEQAAPPFSALQEHGRRFDLLSLRTDVPSSIDAMSSGSSHILSARSSRDQLDSWSPSATNRSSASIWSPVMTEARSPSSVTSIGSSQTKSAALSISKARAGAVRGDSHESIDTLRQQTTSLLISDIANSLFGAGSETDLAFWTGLGGELTEKYLRTLAADSSSQDQPSVSQLFEFNFEKAFEKLISRFSASSNPYVKLKILLDIDTLLAPYLDSLATRRSETPMPTIPKQMTKEAPSKVVDVKVEGFRRLFCKKATRPSAVFRDLQYIAALVPSRTLETSAQGKAFWNAAVAISGLRQDLCTIMVETADSIIAHHSNKRGQGRSSSVAQRQRDSAAFPVPSRSPSPEDVSRHSMSDAAWLLQITAREGDAVAQRELATLYLTHPELMDHIIAPLSRPRDVFKEELESKWRKNQDPARCDPTTMCVAHHWMSLSSKGGDALATEFLRQREEMERLP